MAGVPMTIRPKIIAAMVAVVAVAGCVDRTAEQYREYARFVTRDGGMRAERSPEDAQFSNAELATNFEKIALNREYRREEGKLIEATTPSLISRWRDPIRYQILGGGVTPLDKADYAELAARLTDLTGVEVAEGDSDPNVTILILTADERRAFIDELEEDGIAERMPLVIEWAQKLSYPCVGQVGYRDANTGQITGAMIVIKAELEGLFRKSCIHEELVQTMGLMNDDKRVRPSIFNDDQEFALLTEHDEYLLRILYDDRLQPGMEANEALPLVPAIIEDLRPETDAAAVN
ncbi:MAG: DUF2927 domain-containing protein [Pseudomonadota bacterium]